MIQKILFSVSFLFLTLKAYTASSDRVVLKPNAKKEEALKLLKKTEGGFRKFVLSEGGDLVISSTGEDGPKHGDLASKAKSAGYIKLVVEDSGVSSLRLNNRSGKFCPSYESLSLVENFLRSFFLDKATSERYYLPNLKKCVVLSSPDKDFVKESDLGSLSALPENFSLFRYLPEVYKANKEKVKAELPFSFPKLKIERDKPLEKVVKEKEGDVTAYVFLSPEDLFSSQVSVNMKREGYDLHTFFNWNEEGVTALLGTVKLESGLTLGLNIFASYPRFVGHDDIFKEERTIAIMKVLEPFYKKYKKVLVTSYKQGNYFTLNVLKQEGATEEMLSLMNGDAMTALIKGQELAGSLSLREKTVSFEVLVRVEQLFKWLSIFYSLDSL